MVGTRKSKKLHNATYTQMPAEEQWAAEAKAKAATDEDDDNSKETNNESVVKNNNTDAVDDTQFVLPSQDSRASASNTSISSEDTFPDSVRESLIRAFDQGSQE